MGRLQPVFCRHLHWRLEGLLMAAISLPPFNKAPHSTAAATDPHQPADVALLHPQQAGFLKAREAVAHSLQVQAEVAADLLARHAQQE